MQWIWSYSAETIVFRLEKIMNRVRFELDTTWHRQVIFIDVYEDHALSILQLEPGGVWGHRFNNY